MRPVSLLLALCGCDQLFDLERIELVDAAAIDAAFDPQTCPAEYSLALHPGTRYRIGEVYTQAWNASDDCNDDRPGFTHLAVAPGREEVDVLIAAIVARGGGRWWVGAVQPVTAPTVGGDWLWMTGEAVAAALWDVPVEPNDGEGTETDHAEQFTILEGGVAGLIDIVGSSTTALALCECDGRPATPAATSAVDQSRL